MAGKELARPGTLMVRGQAERVAAVTGDCSLPQPSPWALTLEAFLLTLLSYQSSLSSLCSGPTGWPALGLTPLCPCKEACFPVPKIRLATSLWEFEPRRSDCSSVPLWKFS